MAMEFIQGMSLAEFMTEAGRLSPYIACYIGMEIAKGLKYAHEQGIYHRDIKPGNVMISNNGEVKITDFGIAVKSERTEENDLTRTGTILGTPAYMSPEQIRSPKTVDHRTDIYSLGILIYEMLSGIRPYGNDFSMDNLVNIRKGRYKSLTKMGVVIPDFLKNLLKKMMSPSKTKRLNSLNIFISKCKFFIEFRFGSTNNLKKIISYYIKSNFKSYPVASSLDGKFYKKGSVENALSYSNINNLSLRLMKTGFSLLIIIIILSIFSTLFSESIVRLTASERTGILLVNLKNNDFIHNSTIIIKPDKINKNRKTINIKQAKTKNNIRKKVILPVDKYTIIWSLPNQVVVKDIYINPISNGSLKNNLNTIDFEIEPNKIEKLNIEISVKDQANKLIKKFDTFYKLSGSDQWIRYTSQSNIQTGRMYDYSITSDGYLPAVFAGVETTMNQTKLSLSAKLKPFELNGR